VKARGRWDRLNSFGTNQRRMGARSLWISDQIRTLPPQVTTGMRNGARTRMAGVCAYTHGQACFECVRANEATQAEGKTIDDSKPSRVYGCLTTVNGP
ncbi:hypothetical protein ALC62_11746, partial [Cyphomyrmex costatus]